jgi:hypothetical protein
MILDRLECDYPEIPSVVRLKAAILFCGVRYDHCLVEAGDWAFPNFMPFHLPVDLPPYRGKRQVPFPYLLHLEDDTQVRLRVKADSPFIIKRIMPELAAFQGAGWGDESEAAIRIQPQGWAYALYENEHLICQLSFEPRHPWSDTLTSDKTPFKAIGLSQHGDMLVLNPAPGCEYFVSPLGHEKKNLSCQFCLYGLPDQRMKSLGQKLYEAHLPEQQLNRICEACAHEHTHAKHLYLVSGSMVDMAAEGERFVQLAKALHQQGLHERYYIACGSGAVPMGAMRQMKDYGVRGACFNLEVWDEQQFKRVCPGKDHFVGRKRWIQSLEEAVEVFGRGHVMSAFVGGAELEGEGAFSDPQEALVSNLIGARYLLERGIQPIYSLHWKMTGKTRGMEPIYSLDLFLKLNHGLAQLRSEYKLPINSDFFCRRCAYMQLEPDFDYWLNRRSES